jgi:hypothetical protein
MTIRPGDAWGRAGGQIPDLEVEGGDAALAEALATKPAGALVAYRPDRSSDLARALGYAPGRASGHEVTIDVLALDDGSRAVNAVVLGPPPDRLRWWHRSTSTSVEVDGAVLFVGSATSVVVASGQYLRGLDVVPRGHPGDGRAEVQVYAVVRGQRRAMRHRLPGGTHVPHPGIRQRSGQRITVSRERPGTLEVDGRARGRATGLGVEVVPAALRLAL